MLWVCQVVGVITGGGLVVVGFVGACVLVFGCGSVMIGVTPIFGCVWDSMHSCGMWWVAYYSGVSMWVGGLSSLGGVGFVMGWCDVFHGGFGGFGLTGVGVVCIIRGVRLK